VPARRAGESCAGLELDERWEEDEKR
jgi:hypothetical protein